MQLNSKKNRLHCKFSCSDETFAASNSAVDDVTYHLNRFIPTEPATRPINENWNTLYYLENLPSKVKFFTPYIEFNYDSEEEFISELRNFDEDVETVLWQESDYVLNLNESLVPKVPMRDPNFCIGDSFESFGQEKCGQQRFEQEDCELESFNYFNENSFRTLKTRPPGNYIPLENKFLTQYYDLLVVEDISKNMQQRKDGLGIMHNCSDSLIAKIALITGILDLKSILNLGVASRILYQLTNWESEVWRHICLERRNGDFIFCGSWKINTFYSFKGTDIAPAGLLDLFNARRYLSRKIPEYAEKYQEYSSSDLNLSETTDNECKNMENNLFGDNPYVKMNVENQIRKSINNNVIIIPGFFSSLMWEEWYMSEMELSGWFSNTYQIPRILAADYTIERFIEKFLKPQFPCVITDLVPCWPAFYNWQPEELLKKYSETLFKLDEYSFSGQRIKMILRDYIIYCRRNLDSSPLYIFDGTFPDRAPLFLEDYSIPEYFWEDLFAVLDNQFRPHYRWWLYGPSHSGTPFHKDPNGTYAWNALISGYKRWALYPPNVKPPGMISNDNALRWYFQVYPNLPSNLKPIEFVQGPGDLVFIPANWWHLVLNLSETVSITQNMVGTYNFDKVVRNLVNEEYKLFILFKHSLISVRPEMYKKLLKIEVEEVNNKEIKRLKKENQEYQKILILQESIKKSIL